MFITWIGKKSTFSKFINLNLENIWAGLRPLYKPSRYTPS